MFWASMIRRALVEDCGQLAELHTMAWKDAYKDILPKSFLDGLDVSARKVNWEKVIAQDLHLVFLHIVDEELSGFAAICPSRDEDVDSTFGEISSIYYQRSAWGQGFADELMAHVLSELSGTGYEKTTLWVLRKNDRAISFYKKHGFCPDGMEQEFERNGVVFDEIRMIRS